MDSMQNSIIKLFCHLPVTGQFEQISAGNYIHPLMFLMLSSHPPSFLTHLQRAEDRSETRPWALRRPRWGCMVGDAGKTGPYFSHHQTKGCGLNILWGSFQSKSLWIRLLRVSLLTSPGRSEPGWPRVCSGMRLVGADGACLSWRRRNQSGHFRCLPN